MNIVGQPELATQKRVIALLRDELGYRYLGDTESVEGRFYYHFTGELHPGSQEDKPENRCSGKSSQAAINISDRRPKEELPEPGQPGVPKPAVFPGHSPRHNLAATLG